MYGLDPGEPFVECGALVDAQWGLSDFVFDLRIA
jgi:hypothetical protein